MAKGFGFGNLQVTANEFMPGEAIIGQQFLAYPTLTKTGTDPLCLYLDVYRVSGTSKELVGTVSKEITYTYAATKIGEGIPVFKDNAVPVSGASNGASSKTYAVDEWVTPENGKVLPESVKKIDSTTNSMTATIEDNVLSTGTLVIYLKDPNRNGVYCDDAEDEFSIGDDKHFKKFETNCAMEYSGWKVTFKSLTVAVQHHNSLCQINGGGDSCISRMHVTLSSTSAGSQSATQYLVEFVGGEKRKDTCDGSYRFTTTSYSTYFTARPTATTASTTQPTVLSGSFAPITIKDSAGNEIKSGSDGFIHLDKSNSNGYKIYINKPSTNGEIESVTITELGSNGKNVGPDKFTDITTTGNSYYIADIKDSLQKYEDGVTYTLKVEVTPKAGDKQTLTTNFIAETKCGPAMSGADTTTLGTCKSECTEIKDITKNLDSNPGCTGKNDKCCLP